MFVSESFLARVKQYNEMMKNGIFHDTETGLAYFSGYSVNMLADWDQYFEAIIQMYMGWNTAYIKNGIKIFLSRQMENGFIQRIIPANLEYPEKEEHAKPFLAQTAILLVKKEKHLDWLTVDEYERIKRSTLYWLECKDANHNWLPTWDSAPHAGMDTQVERAGAWHASFCEGVDLACYLYRECLALSRLAAYYQIDQDARAFQSHAQSIKNAVQTLLWDEQDGFFYDCNEKTGDKIRLKASAGFMPLWAGIASPLQAKRMIQEHLLNPDEFWRPFPVSSYSASEASYRENYLETDVGSNWKGAAWIPVNYCIMHGLLDYGYHDIAKALASMSWRMISSRRSGYSVSKDQDWYKAGSEVTSDYPWECYTSDSKMGFGLTPFWGFSLLACFMPMECTLCYNPTKIEWDEMEDYDVKPRI